MHGRERERDQATNFEQKHVRHGVQSVDGCRVVGDSRTASDITVCLEAKGRGRRKAAYALVFTFYLLWVMKGCFVGFALIPGFGRVRRARKAKQMARARRVRRARRATKRKGRRERRAKPRSFSVSFLFLFPWSRHKQGHANRLTYFPRVSLKKHLSKVTRRPLLSAECPFFRVAQVRKEC